MNVPNRRPGWLTRTVIVLTLLLLASPIMSQSWDVGDNEAPPTSDAKPLPKPTEIRPFHLVAYNDCKTGRLAFDVISEYSSVGFDPTTIEDTVFVKLRTYNRGKKTSRVSIPGEVFYLNVILGKDTAVFKVDNRQEILVLDYIKVSELLRIQEIKELPENVLYFQFMNGEKGKDVKKFLERLGDEFGDQVNHVVLEKGFYRCIPIPWVSNKKMGRRQRTNKTFLGYLVCVEVDPEAYETIEAWLWEEQKVQFKLAGLDERGDRP